MSTILRFLIVSHKNRIAVEYNRVARFHFVTTFLLLAFQ